MRTNSVALVLWSASATPCERQAREPQGDVVITRYELSVCAAYWLRIVCAVVHSQPRVRDKLLAWQMAVLADVSAENLVELMEGGASLVLTQLWAGPWLDAVLPEFPWQYSTPKAMSDTLARGHAGGWAIAGLPVTVIGGAPWEPVTRGLVEAAMCRAAESVELYQMAMDLITAAGAPEYRAWDRRHAPRSWRRSVEVGGGGASVRKTDQTYP